MQDIAYDDSDSEEYVDMPAISLDVYIELERDKKYILLAADETTFISEDIEDALNQSSSIIEDKPLEAPKSQPPEID